MDFARQLRTARTAARLSQAELARRAGTSQSRISSYEQGKVTPARTTRERLIEASRPTPSRALFEQREQVMALAERRHAINVRVFGSCARGEDTSQSDIDLVVTFDPDASLFDQVGLEMDLSELIGYPVQVVSDRSVKPDSSIARDAVRL
jgi:hypothetical protein